MDASIRKPEAPVPIYSEHLMECLVCIEFYAYCQRLFWDFHEPLESFFPVHFTLTREGDELVLWLKGKQEERRVSFLDFMEKPLFFQLENPDFKITLSSNPTDPLAILRNPHEWMSIPQYVLIQGFGPLIHQVTLLSDQETMMLEGVPVFSFQKDPEGYRMVSFIDDLEISLASAPDQKVFLSDQILLSHTDLQTLRLKFRELWWQCCPAELVDPAQFWNQALLDEDTAEIADVGDAALLKGSIGWSILILLVFIPFLVLVQYFQDKPRKIEKLAEIQIPLQSKPVVIEKPKPVPPKPKPLPPKPKPIPPKPKPKIEVIKPKKSVPLKKILLKPAPAAPARASLFRQQIQKKFVALKPSRAPFVPHPMPSRAPAPLSKMPPPPARVVHAAPSAPAINVQKSQVLSALNFLSAPAPIQHAVFAAPVVSNHYASHWAQGSVQSHQLSRLRNKSFGSNSTLDTTESIQSYSSRAKGAASGVARRGKFFNEVQGKVSIAGLSSANGSGLGSASSVRVTGKGSASESAILKALSSHLAAFQYCYEKALLTNPGLSGQVVMQWGISTSGSVHSVQTVRTEIQHQGLMGCIANELKRINFPAPKGGAVTIEYPFSFSSQKI